MPRFQLESVPGRKRPIRARSFALCWGALLIGLRAAVASPDASLLLGENQVVSMALKRHSLAEAIDGAVAVEEGRGGAAGAYPNPELSYSREQTFGTYGTDEDYLALSQTIDLANRRGLRRDAGTLRAHASRHEGDAARQSIAADARLRFYEVLYRQGRVIALETSIERIANVVAIVTRRSRGGEASDFDRKRMERERVVMQGQLESEAAALQRATARLLALLDGDVDSVRLHGNLLPEADPPPLDDLRVSSAARPELNALEQRLRAASLERTAASRWWLPDLVLQGGWKGVNVGESQNADGFSVGASLSVPLWNEFAGLLRMAEGEALAARGRRALLVSEVEAELAGARSEVCRLRRAASDFRSTTTVIASDLMRIAAAGYAGGEMTLLELLDAQRGAVEDALRALDMEHAARRAQIELDRMTGRGLP